MPVPRTELDERFDGGDLDLDVWLPSYLPHWSSRAAAAATYAVRGGELVLTIPPDQGLWCEDTHDVPLRVSCLQTGNHSGPVGSATGPQTFRDGLLVQEEQPTWWGYTPLYGHIEVRMRGTITPRSMVAFWLSGIEDRPERSGEICVMEVFGDAVRDGGADVGMGLRRLRDPALTEAWSTGALPIDVAEFHTYAVDWRPGSLAFSVDGEVVREVGQAPDYPVQLMLGVFDFPAKAGPGDDTVPELVASHVRGRPLG